MSHKNQLAMLMILKKFFLSMFSIAKADNCTFEKWYELVCEVATNYFGEFPTNEISGDNPIRVEK